MSAEVHAVTVHAPSVEGIDPKTMAQAAQLTVQLIGAVATKNFGGAFSIGFQLAALLLQAYAPTPAPIPLPES